MPKQDKQLFLLIIHLFISFNWSQFNKRKDLINETDVTRMIIYQIRFKIYILFLSCYDRVLPENSVVTLVIAGERNHRTKCNSDRIEVLGSCIDPHLGRKL